MTARNTTPASGLPTRDRLAVEAARMFAERGYHGTSINDLAVALGLHKSSLYARRPRGNDSSWPSGRTWRWWKASSTWPRSGSRNGAT